MANKIVFSIIAILLAGFVSAMAVLLVATYGFLAMFYPFIVLFIASITAYCYRKFVCEEKGRVVTMLIISVLSACIASFPIVLIERQAQVATLDSVTLLFASFPIASYVHAIIFVVLFFAPSFFFPCRTVSDQFTSLHEVSSKELREQAAKPVEFKEIEEAVKERDLAKEKREELKASKAASKDSKADKKTKKSSK